MRLDCWAPRPIGTFITRFRAAFFALEAWKLFDACFAIEIIAGRPTVRRHQDASAIAIIFEGKTYATVSRVLFASSIASRTYRL